MKFESTLTQFFSDCEHNDDDPTNDLIGEDDDPKKPSNDLIKEDDLLSSLTMNNEKCLTLYLLF